MDQMTPEAKAAVMQLMGQTYGQQKKQDEMLVGQSGNLRPKSEEMKNMVEQLVRTPVVPGTQQQQQQRAQAQAQQAQAQAQAQAQQPQAAPAPAGPPAPVTPEQAMAQLQQAPATPPLEVNAFAPVPGGQTQEQLGFDFSEPGQFDQLLEAVKESNLLLKAIKLQLENSNVQPKRKSVKAKITE